MLYSAIEMVQRAAFLICGLITVLISRVYGGLAGLLPGTTGIGWSLYSYGLLVVGVVAIGISLLPTAWAPAVSKRPYELRLVIPLRFLLSFAAVGLVLVVIFSLVPPSLGQPPMALVYSFCPACVVTVTVDPSLATAIFMLAPLNALVFGAVGGVIGMGFSILTR